VKRCAPLKAARACSVARLEARILQVKSIERARGGPAVEVADELRGS